MNLDDARAMQLVGSLHAARAPFRKACTSGRDLAGIAGFYSRDSISAVRISEIVDNLT